MAGRKTSELVRRPFSSEGRRNISAIWALPYWEAFLSRRWYRRAGRPFSSLGPVCIVTRDAGLVLSERLVVQSEPAGGLTVGREWVSSTFRPVLLY